MPPGGYSYNIDPNYGAVSMITDENKLGPGSGQPSSQSIGIGSLKEERNKESPSPSEQHPKIGQVSFLVVK